MFLLRYFNGTALLVLMVALLLSFLLYLKNIKTKIIPIANMCSLLVFLFSLLCAIDLLAGGIGDPALFAQTLANTIIMNLYAGIYNVLARVYVRITEMMGNKRVKLSIHAEIVER